MLWLINVCNMYAFFCTEKKYSHAINIVLWTENIENNCFLCVLAETYIRKMQVSGTWCEQAQNIRKSNLHVFFLSVFIHIGCEWRLMNFNPSCRFFFKSEFYVSRFYLNLDLQVLNADFYSVSKIPASTGAKALFKQLTGLQTEFTFIMTWCTVRKQMDYQKLKCTECSLGIRSVWKASHPEAC